MGLTITASCDKPGIEPRSVVTPPALRCSALDRCTTREPKPAWSVSVVAGGNLHGVCLWWLGETCMECVCGGWGETCMECVCGGWGKPAWSVSVVAGGNLHGVCLWWLGGNLHGVCLWWLGETCMECVCGGWGETRMITLQDKGGLPSCGLTRGSPGLILLYSTDKHR
jgi:hypothetical protein